ncbi:MAG: hypothetical protein ACOVNV_05335, partial [Pirellulaceae bacterium]
LSGSDSSHQSTCVRKQFIAAADSQRFAQRPSSKSIIWQWQLPEAHPASWKPARSRGGLLRKQFAPLIRHRGNSG